VTIQLQGQQGALLELVLQLLALGGQVVVLEHREGLELVLELAQQWELE
jgi:hypothetical protein